jgi:1-acyl-sn-glycerol-3-phosphate acyltransferase
MNWSYAIGKLLFRELARGLFDFRVVHGERLHVPGAALVVANHASFLDPPLIGQAFPEAIHFFARKTLFDHPLAGAILRSWQAIPIDRDKPDPSSLKATLRVLAGGGKVLMFPEGTRTLDGEIKPAQPGAGLFIAKSRAPVLPVRIFGSFEAFSRHHKIPRPATISITVGELWQPDLEAFEDLPAKDLYRQLAEEAMRRVAALEPR